MKSLFVVVLFSLSSLAWSACHFTLDIRNDDQYSPLELDIAREAYLSIKEGSEIVVISAFNRQLKKVQAIWLGKKGICDNRTKFRTDDGDVYNIADISPTVSTFRDLKQHGKAINTFSRLPFVTGDDEITIRAITFDGYVMVDSLLLLKADYLKRY